MGYICVLIVLFISIYSVKWEFFNSRYVLFGIYMLLLLLIGFSYGLPDYSMYERFFYGAVNFDFRNIFGGYEITIETASGESVIEKIPAGPDLLVSNGQTVQPDQPLTNNPNVGGFGQKDVEIVLQNPARIQGLIVFFASVLLAQVLLVLKKKQFEKVQLAEMNF